MLSSRGDLKSKGWWAQAGVVGGKVAVSVAWRVSSPTNRHKERSKQDMQLDYD